MEPTARMESPVIPRPRARAAARDGLRWLANWRSGSGGLVLAFGTAGGGVFLKKIKKKVYIPPTTIIFGT